MILRTPPLRKRRAESPIIESPVSDRHLVVYNDPLSASSLEPSDDLICTHQCRQMVKSEFMVAFNSAEKQVVEYQSKVETLSNELRKSVLQKRSEIIIRTISDLLSKSLKRQRGGEHALQEQLLKEVNDSQERYQIQLKRCCELEAHVKKEVNSRKKAELLAAEAKERATSLEGELQQLSESSKREKNCLQKEMLYLREES